MTNPGSGPRSRRRADYACPPLAEYARRLSGHAARYDVPRVRKAPAELPEIPARIHPTSDKGHLT
jgi:hypothetical protein